MPQTMRNHLPVTVEDTWWRVYYATKVYFI